MEKVNTENPRKALLGYLDGLLTLSHKKIHAERGIKDHTKQGWARVMVQAVGAYGFLLRDKELEELAKEIEMIKEKMKCPTN